MGFGDFGTICAQSALPICQLLGPPSTLTTAHQPLLLTTCSARSIELANTIIFQAATDFAHIGALIMTTIMILHVRSKFTAVGRKEILTFFYIYLILTCISLVLDAGVIQGTSGGAFPYFVAIQNGLTGALCTSLLINGFVGFQLYEDGTALSVWLLRGTCVGMFLIEFLVSVLTFKGWAGLGPENTTVLFAILYVLPALFLFVYVVMQFFLVLNTLQDRWPLGDLLFGTMFFIVGQVLLYAIGTTICEATSHYLDSVFFATICNLLAVMMVYKVSCHVISGSNIVLTLSSTGIRSRKKISNSVSAQNKATGKSSTLFSLAEKTTTTRNASPFMLCLPPSDNQRSMIIRRSIIMLDLPRTIITSATTRTHDYLAMATHR